MLALVAGQGALPAALVARLPQRPLICAMQGSEPDNLRADITFRLEHLGSVLADLCARGVTQLCMAGAVTRPKIDPTMIDAATQPLVPAIQTALASGDDTALRAMIGVIEGHGIHVVAAHDIAPDLLPPTGVLTDVRPGKDVAADAIIGAAEVARMGAADVGQACIVHTGQVAGREGPEGTDALLAGYGERGHRGGLLFKAPKPQQDRRADLPLIGLATAQNAAAAGLAGIVIAAGGVMVLDGPDVIDTLNRHKMYLWVRA